MGQFVAGDEARGGALATTWHSRHARRIEDSLSASSPEVSNDKDDTMMETGSDDSARATAPPVHAGFTMEQAHYTMAEVQSALAPLSVFRDA